MHLDHDPVGARRNRGPADRSNQAAPAGGVRGVGDDRQVRKFPDQGDSGDVKGVAQFGLEGADAAFTQHHVGISSRQQVFGRQQPLPDAGRRTALEKDRAFRDGHLPQQGEVLHVARPHLQHVGVLGNQLDVFRAQHFGDHRQAGYSARFAQQTEPFLAQSLEVVGGGAGLVGASAQHAGACGPDRKGSAEQLFPRLHRARPGDDHHLVAPDGDAPNVHHSALRLELPAHQPKRQFFGRAWLSMVHECLPLPSTPGTSEIRSQKAKAATCFVAAESAEACMTLTHEVFFSSACTRAAGAAAAPVAVS